ncbi:MAG: hypothetical protein VKL60_14485 [Sphaerospermopsis sp.]|jgi:ABC-type phosphate transport system permease subunit|nr:hypothetical protein [Sphaerospermopsis sp.]
MEFSIGQALNVFQSAPLILISLLGVFVIGLLMYNMGEQKTQQQEKDTNLVLSILSAMLILALMIVATQV